MNVYINNKEKGGITLKKPLKVLSKASLAAVLSASVLVPTVTAEAAESIPTEALKMDVVVAETVDGKLASLPYEKFLNAYFAGIKGTENITHIGAKDGSNYSYERFLDAFFSSKETFEGAFEKLYKGNAQDESSEIYEGYVENGKL